MGALVLFGSDDYKCLSSVVHEGGVFDFSLSWALGWKVFWEYWRPGNGGFVGVHGFDVRGVSGAVDASFLVEEHRFNWPCSK